MKAITVRQPWAWAIATGAKLVENRQAGFPAKYRGPLAIHAGKGWSYRGLADDRILALARLNDVEPAELPLGVIVAVCQLAGVHHAEEACCDSPWAETSYVINGGKTITDVAHLVLADVEALAEPVACRGALGLWTPPLHVLAALA